MPDTPDFYKYLPNSVRFSLQDMGELASRLGSIHRFDRRGELLWFDDFRHGLGGWNSTGGGTGAIMQLGVSPVHISPYCMKIVAGSDGSQNILAYHFIDVFDITKIALEVALATDGNFDTFDMELRLTDDTQTIRGIFRVDFVNSRIQYYNSSGSFTTLDDFPFLEIDPGFFQLIKFVLDFDNATYVRFIFGDRHYEDLSIAANSGIAGSQRAYEILLTGTSSSGNAGNGYIGHVLFTSNEP